MMTNFETEPYTGIFLRRHNEFVIARANGSDMLQMSSNTTILILLDDDDSISKTVYRHIFFGDITIYDIARVKLLAHKGYSVYSMDQSCSFRLLTLYNPIPTG